MATSFETYDSCIDLIPTQTLLVMHSAQVVELGIEARSR
jgi:hypothetical protein